MVVIRAIVVRAIVVRAIVGRALVGRAVVGRERASVCRDDAPADGQPQAYTRGAGVDAAYELLEDALLLARRDAGAIVGDVDLDPTVDQPRGDRDGGIGGRVRSPAG